MLKHSQTTITFQRTKTISLRYQIVLFEAAQISTSKLRHDRRVNANIGKQFALQIESFMVEILDPEIFIYVSTPMEIFALNHFLSKSFDFVCNNNNDNNNHNHNHNHNHNNNNNSNKAFLKGSKNSQKIASKTHLMNRSGSVSVNLLS